MIRAQAPGEEGPIRGCAWLQRIQQRGVWAGWSIWPWPFALGAYFTFAAVQGDYGMFARVAIKAEADDADAPSATG